MKFSDSLSSEKSSLSNSISGRETIILLKKFRKFLSETGQGVVEYALLIGFVAVITVGLFGTDSEEGLKETFRSTLSGIMGQFTQFNESYNGG